jgi:hypothetical protein
LNLQQHNIPDSRSLLGEKQLKDLQDKLAVQKEMFSREREILEAQLSSTAQEKRDREVQLE